MKLKLIFTLLLCGWLFIPASAQNPQDMYTYKQIGNKYVVSIQNRAEIVKALNAFCEERGIQSERFLRRTGHPVGNHLRDRGDR